MEKLKRVIACLGVFIVLGSYYKSNYKYEASYEILDDSSDAYAKYCDGNIYIGDSLFLSRIECDRGDILILDNRYNLFNPDVKILASCEIKDKNIRNDIIEVLQIYESENPSPWNRTTESMRLEWLMHNLFYDFQFKTDSTFDVDLDNNDEVKYQNKILNKIFKI